jgi:diguanylate cyclase (GGDEF)-like protein
MSQTAPAETTAETDCLSPSREHMTIRSTSTMGHQDTAPVPEPDLTLCENEPIHAPGAVQPHGAMLVALADGLAVTHASANLAAILGCSPDAVLGRPLEDALGEDACRVLFAVALREGSVDGHEDSRVHAMVRPDGVSLHLHAFRTGRHICVDIEPMKPEAVHGPSDILLRSVLESFTHAIAPLELSEFGVRGLKAITGYDRVMAYRFGDDGHGEVIAEAREPELEPYLGLNYPAGDIPQPARRLFARQRVCEIADTGYVPVPLLSNSAPDEDPTLDLTQSALRSVSPIHRAYLRNMKVPTSLSIALMERHGANDQRLWGMFVCHNATTRSAGPELRAVAGTIGQVASLLLRSLSESAVHAERLKRNASLRVLVERLIDPAPSPGDWPPEAVAELLGLVDAAGALLQIPGAVLSFGCTPPSPMARRALKVLLAQGNGEVLAFDRLGLSHPDLAGCTAEGSGVLLAPLPGMADSAILWFRPERVRTVTWGGNPAEHVTTDPYTGRLCPRGSFAAWKEIENGHAVPWDAADLAIVQDLRRLVGIATTERTSAALARLRHFDPLTGLANRSLLEDQLRDTDPLAPGGLLFLDLDGFKSVNDTMGHAAGDELLIEVARRLVSVAGPGNLTARLGGDEFVVLCHGMTPAEISALGERIRKAIEAPIEIEGRPCHVSSSIGVALNDRTGGLDRVRAADIAMYAAKQAGGNRAVLFEAALFDRASRLFSLEQDMREALRAGDNFVLLYQPLFGVLSGARRLVGFEALVRWRHPRHGWMSPAVFIPMAEKSGLILPLGDWVLATALRQGRALRRAYPAANLIVNVNVSALQLPREGFCTDVAEALEAEGFPPTALCLEVTESMLTDARAAAVLTEIRMLGVEVAIDDFGIGYSSLSYLRRLPVDKVKLDRSFLEDIEGDPLGVGFVSAVIALAHAAGKPVVFEGIETQAQLDIAVATGADVVQGFFFAPPLSISAARELAAQHRELDERRASLHPVAEQDPAE